MDDDEFWRRVERQAALPPDQYRLGNVKTVLQASWAVITANSRGMTLTVMEAPQAPDPAIALMRLVLDGSGSEVFIHPVGVPISDLFEIGRG